MQLTELYLDGENGTKAATVMFRGDRAGARRSGAEGVLRASGLRGKPRGRAERPVEGSGRSGGHRRWGIAAAQMLAQRWWGWM